MDIEQSLRTQMHTLVAAPPAAPDRWTSVERRAHAVRRRRLSAAAAVVAVLVAVPAVQALRPEPRVPAVDRLARELPRDVVLEGGGERLVLSGFPGEVARAGVVTAPIREARQLRTGEIVGLQAGRIVVLTRDGVRDLGASDKLLIGLDERSVWLVEDRSEAISVDDPERRNRFGGDRVQRVALDGEQGPVFTLPDDMRAAGEVADGLVAYQRVKYEPKREGNGVSFTEQVDLVVVQPATGAIVRRIGEDVIVEDMYADTLVWRYSGCSDTEECSYRVVDRHTGATRLLQRKTGFEGTERPARLSPDGRWLAYSRLARHRDDSGLFVVDLVTGSARHVSEQYSMSYIWSGTRLLFLDNDADRVGVFLPATGSTTYAPGHSATAVLGAFDLLDASR